MEKEPKIELNTEKEARIKDMEMRVGKKTDKLGMHIDEGIKEAVAGFNINDVPTSQSCEGHLEEHGMFFPWVEVYPSPPKGCDKDEKGKEEWKMQNLKYRQKATELLDEFYKDRDVPFDARLHFANIGTYGGFRVQSIGGEVMRILSAEEQKEKLLVYREEMNAFAKFLKDKFINS